MLSIYSAAESEYIVAHSLRWMHDHVASVDTTQRTAKDHEALPREDPEMQPKNFYVNQADQADIARTIFDVLTDEQAPCIVIGNLGFALASCRLR